MTFLNFPKTIAAIFSSKNYYVIVGKTEFSNCTVLNFLYLFSWLLFFRYEQAFCSLKCIREPVRKDLAAADAVPMLKTVICHLNSALADLYPDNGTKDCTSNN